MVVQIYEYHINDKCSMCPHEPYFYFTLSNARQFHSSRDESCRFGLKDSHGTMADSFVNHYNAILLSCMMSKIIWS